MVRFFKALGVLSVTALLIGVACSPSSDSAEPSTPTTTGAPVSDSTESSTDAPRSTASVTGVPLDADATYGGVLQIAVTGFGPSFSPWEERSGGTGAVIDPVSNHIVQNQSWGTPEETAQSSWFTLQPDLATSWEQSSDGLEWVFNLRDGVKWSDGVAFTCADAKWSLDSIRTGEGLKRSPAATHFLAIDLITCADDQTMVISLNKPKASLLTVIGLPFNTIRPKHIYENNFDLLRETPPDVGTGPFTVSEFIPGEKMVFERNSDYWNQPFPYLDGVNLQILSTQSITTALRAGRLDFGAFQGYNGAKLQTLQQGCSACIFYDKIVNPSFNDVVMINHQRAPWNDPLIKDAISYGLDRAKTNKLVYLGDSILPHGGPFVPGSGWEMPYDRVSQIPGYDFTDPAGNKQKAKDLLAQAGYEPGELKVEITFWSVIQDSIPSIIEDFQAIGIDATPLILETALAYTAWSDGNFDIGVHGFWYVTADPDEMLYEHFYAGSDRNYNRYSNMEVDRLIDEMSVTVDPELRQQRAWDVSEIIMREQGKILMSFGTYVPVRGPDVEGWAPASAWLSISGPGVRWEHVWLNR